jgi:hypothetical protein
MTGNLNWKAGGINNVEAWASRAVGGKYRIECRQGSDAFHRPNGPMSFEVSRYTTSGNGQWNYDKELGYRTVFTMQEAIAIAEADNQRRLDGGRRPQRQGKNE